MQRKSKFTINITVTFLSLDNKIYYIYVMEFPLVTFVINSHSINIMFICPTFQLDNYMK